MENDTKARILQSRGRDGRQDGAQHGRRSSIQGCRPPNRPGAACLAGLTAAVLCAAALSLCLGARQLAPGAVLRALLGMGTDAERAAADIVCYVRLPRTAGCLLAGAALAASGAVIQTVLANPLAAPNIIGVNAGAGLGVAACCALAPGAAALTPLAAFWGAFGGVSLVIALSRRAGASRMTLVLAGVAVSGMLSAGVDLVLTLVPDALVGYSDFRIGGLAQVSMNKVAPAAWVIVPCLAALMLLAGELDVLALGEDVAHSLGLRVRAVRLALLALAAALAGAAVSFAGLLGFVGLVAPHIARRLVGSEARRLLPGAALLGALLLTLCDVAARVLFAPFELPVGIVLSLAGGPFFLWLLLRQKRG
ncbi:MAG: iron ABC transporter permease [Subdoligranulum sp.]|nr:iron ABC transporter permease [Subdoligranulum sp.]